MTGEKVKIDMPEDELQMLRCLDMVGPRGAQAMEVCMMCGYFPSSIRSVRRRLDKLVDYRFADKTRRAGRCLYHISETAEKMMGGSIYLGWLGNFGGEMK